MGAVADWPADAPPDDQYYAGYQGDFPLIGVPGAWQLTTGTHKVIVALLDTGVQRTHPDLSAIPWILPRGTSAC